MPGLRETRECAHCGKSLTRLVSQIRGQSWYCDHRCQAAHAPSRITERRTIKVAKVCDCGKPFETYPSVDKRHCSRSCSSRFHPKKPKTGALVPCEQCGTEFWRIVSNTDARFCSKSCHDDSQRREQVIKACGWCGKTLTLKPSQAAIQFCSQRCAGESKIRRPLLREHNGRRARLDQHGYVLVWQPDHPAPASLKGWVYEHRLAAAASMGRPLTSDEQVDHINRDKADNRPDNLQVLDGPGHAIKTQADQRADRHRLAEYERRYGPLA